MPQRGWGGFSAPPTAHRPPPHSFSLLACTGSCTTTPPTRRGRRACRRIPWRSSPSCTLACTTPASSPLIFCTQPRSCVKPFRDAVCCPAASAWLTAALHLCAARVPARRVPGPAPRHCRRRRRRRRRRPAARRPFTAQSAGGGRGAAAARGAFLLGGGRRTHSLTAGGDIGAAGRGGAAAVFARVFAVPPARA